MKSTLFSFLLTFTTATVFLMSCSAPAPDTKEQYLKDYSAFIQDLKENKDNLSEEQWAEKDKQFKAFSDELFNQYKDEMGALEKINVGKHAFQYTRLRGMNAFKNISESGELDEAIKDIKDVVNSGEIEDAINEFKNVWNDDMKGDFEQAFSELQNVWDDDLKGQLGSSLDEIKAALEDEDLQVEINGKVEELKAVLEDEEVKGKVKDIITELKGVLEKAEQELEK